MPCYEPPENKSAYLPGSATMKKYVATLNEIEEYCKGIIRPPGFQAPVPGYLVAQSVLDIIDTHWGKKDG
jgi:hypothetical protein